MSVGTQALAEMRGETSHQERTFEPNSNAQIAYDLRKAVDALNQHLRKAAEAGIDVRFNDRVIMRVSGTDQQQVEVSLSKVL